MLHSIPQSVSLVAVIRKTLTWSAICLICVAAIALGTAGKLPIVPAIVLGPIIVTAAPLSAYFAVLAIAHHRQTSDHVRRFLADDAPKIQAALDDGRARVTIIAAENVVAIENDFGEDVAYLYDLGDGKSLFLDAARYQPMAPDAPWPARRFEIVHAATDGRFIGVVAASDVLEPSEVIGAAVLSGNRRLEISTPSETILEGAPAEIIGSN